MKTTTSTARALQLRSSLVSSPWKSTEIWKQLFRLGMRKQYVKCLLAHAHPKAKEGLLPLEPSFRQLSPNTEFTHKIFIKFVYNPPDAHVAEHPTTKICANNEDILGWTSEEAAREKSVCAHDSAWSHLLCRVLFTGITLTALWHRQLSAPNPGWPHIPYPPATPM